MQDVQIANNIENPCFPQKREHLSYLNIQAHAVI